MRSVRRAGHPAALDAVREAMLGTGDPVEGARSRLSPEAFAAAVDVGRRVTLDQAIADALGSTETAPAR